MAIWRLSSFWSNVVVISIFAYFLALDCCLFSQRSVLGVYGSSINNDDDDDDGSTVVVTVFSHAQDNPIARKQRQEIELSLESDKIILETTILTLEEQRTFIQSHDSCGQGAIDKFDELIQRQQEHLAVELWKYCALQSQQPNNNNNNNAVYVDASSPLLLRLHNLLETKGWASSSSSALTTSSSSVAVLGDYFSQTIHGSLLALRPEHRQVAKDMLKVLIETPVSVLEVSPLLIPRTLYALIAITAKDKELKSGENENSWYLLEQSCHINPLRRSSSSEQLSWTDTNSYRLAHHCPDKSGFCCSVYDTSMRQVVLMSRHPLLPYQIIPNDLNRPYNAEAGHYEEDELPFISTIREEVFRRPDDHPATLNFFDMLAQNECLPSNDECSKCLREKKGSDCNKCAKACPCYCKTLCHEKVEPKFVKKKLFVTPPLFSRDPNRLIPRVVHQTWFEPLSRESYPNMSRLVESFKQSGWEYKFYSDEDAANFLSTHFPAEVREAYDALRPGAFKADLFRYCALLIHGGVYADVDIMLESSLDMSIAPDVGFMVPVDEPGSPVNRRMCLWNGFIAAAPGHPFLIKAIETVVNQVRNRFTAVDTDATFCPNPELSILHAFDTLFTAGPCLLGSSLNRVLGRHGQTSFKPGELEQESKEGTSFVLGADDAPSSHHIPGRSVVLFQIPSFVLLPTGPGYLPPGTTVDKFDMGSHRFTWPAKNLVVAATDLPDSNDRENLKKKSSGGGGGEHYSKTHAKTGIYGLEGLYTNKNKADEDVRIYLDASHRAMATPAATA